MNPRSFTLQDFSSNIIYYTVDDRKEAQTRRRSSRNLVCCKYGPYVVMFVRINFFEKRILSSFDIHLRGVEPLSERVAL